MVESSAPPMFRTKSDRIRRTGARAIFCADCDRNGTSNPKRSHLDPEVSRYLGRVRSPEATKVYLTVNTALRDRRGFGIWENERRRVRRAGTPAHGLARRRCGRDCLQFNAAFGAGTCQRDRDRAEQLPFDVRLRARKSLDRFRPTFRLEGTRHEWAYIHG